MKRKVKSAIGDDLIKNINLKLGRYNESTLVDMLCTAAQQKSYHKKEKFTNNKQRSMFVERLSCLCEFEYTEDTNKYKICKVYQYPKTKAEVKIHKGIYRYLAPLILDKVVNDRNGRQSIFSVYELTKDTNMTNKNYGTMKFAQDEVSSGLSIPYKTVAEYFDKTDGYIYYYIKKCIQLLNIPPNSGFSACRKQKPPPLLKENEENSRRKESPARLFVDAAR